MFQRYGQLMDHIKVLEVTEEKNIELMNDFYQRAKILMLEADESAKVIQSQQPPDRFENNLKGLLFFCSGLVKNKNDLSKASVQNELFQPEKHFLETILEEGKADNPYIRVGRDRALRSNAKEIISNRQSCILEYEQVRGSINYLLSSFI